jgi:hypothetical protein
MDENDEDVVHAGIVSKSQKNPGIQADFVIRHRQVFAAIGQVMKSVGRVP